MSDIIVKTLNADQVKSMGIHNWPIWEKEVSRFDWTYDADEECLILDGEVIVETEKGEIKIGKGDFVSFPKGLSCVWDIKSPIKKHFNFK